LAAQGFAVTVLEDDRRVAETVGAAGAQPDWPGPRVGPASGPRVVLEVAPGPVRAAELARGAQLVVPSPGVPVGHPALVAAMAAGTEVAGEVELAWRAWASRRSRGDGADRLVAITGTNGKTTVTKLVAAMLAASGIRAVAAGNVGLPLLDAVAGDASVLVAEVSSFQLEYTVSFAPDVSCWLNFAPDHLDWHPNLEHYARAKAKVWAHQQPGGTAVLNADDPVVGRFAAAVPAGVEVVTFGSGRADWRVGRGYIEGPGGVRLQADELPRAFPHDLANVAAAMAVALAAGAAEEGCRAAARATPVPPHRVQLVAQAGGTSWYDDSKATTPAAVEAGVAAFGSVVLIAGGRNKGLDLAGLARTVPPVRAVVAIGEAGGEIAEVFTGLVPVSRAGSMAEAVDAAAKLARPGDAVVLSPGCASFDWYSSYSERGDHFASTVRKTLSAGTLEEVGN
jgi:UDP-N-acetylmuramoylalanine--D-glutamate ligase